ncbi:ABC transporter substrate-binding protein [Jeotgalibaca caeni]|uniref:ABC transporter substrate-binding protein n=1 Tax=Jeotgalibaca caeni TaxID=3028623 RepID=UPI00237E34D4|nr:ABC transporter substrate-binding protein [Jeotgalibaca caeni]MDE1548602.1 ABC transporter substrate-binding protein [Jeotgalibaca caeni]
MKMRKWLGLFASFTLLSACAAFTPNNTDTEDTENTTDTDAGTETGTDTTANSGEKIELDFWTFWGSEIRRPIIEEIINDFNESQDEIFVKHTYNPFGDIWTKELAQIAAGNPPDVVINDINATALRGQKQQAESLQPFLEEDDISDWFYPELWEATLYEGESYGIPFTTDTRVLYYNKDLFEAAGLDPEAPPTTWDELEEYARQLDVEEGGELTQMGFYPLYGVGMDVWMLNSAGQNFFDEEGNPQVDTPENAAALEWILEWREHYGVDTVNRYQAQIDSGQANPFFTGELAMIAQTGTFYTQIKQYAPDMNIGVAFLPEREEGSGHTSWGGGFVAEIPKGAKNPEASWKFLKYLGDVHAQEIWASKNFDSVANMEAAETAIDNEIFDEQDSMVYQLTVENMDHTILTPVPLTASDFGNTLNPILDNILLGETSVEDGLQEAQESLERLVESNQ